MFAINHVLYVTKRGIVENAVRYNHRDPADARFCQLHAPLDETGSPAADFSAVPGGYSVRYGSFQEPSVLAVPHRSKIVLLQYLVVIDEGDIDPNGGLVTITSNGGNLYTLAFATDPRSRIRQTVGLPHPTGSIIVHNHVHLRGTDQARIEVKAAHRSFAQILVPRPVKFLAAPSSEPLAGSAQLVRSSLVDADSVRDSLQ